MSMGVRHLFPLIAAMAMGATVVVHNETPEEREARLAKPPDPEDLAAQKREDVRRGAYGPEAQRELLVAEHEEYINRAVEISTAPRTPSQNPAAVAIREQTMSRKEYNFRKRLPRGHPDRIED